MAKKDTAVFYVLALLGLAACTRKGDFPSGLPSGIHYYPVILNSRLYDTVSRKYLNLTDTVFSPGDTLVFGFGYFSRDPVDSLELWAGKSPGSLEEAAALAPDPARLLDTVFFSYVLPAPKDSLSKWYLQARVLTRAGLAGHLNAQLRIR